MKIIYISPHFDDVVYSCGGFIWDQVNAGHEVEIWTICGGDPPQGELSPFAQELHTRWESTQNGVLTRRKEDLVACQLIGATPFHFAIQDCIYRKIDGKFIYDSEQSIFGELHSSDNLLISQICHKISQKLSGVEVIIGPIGIGGHVDHQLTRKIIENLPGIRKGYYPEFPYTKDLELAIIEGFSSNTQISRYPVSDEGMGVWKRAIEAYSSQFSTFWQHPIDVEEDLLQIKAKFADQLFFMEEFINIS